MSIDERREMTSLGRFRAAALIAVVAGAVGSIGLLLHAGQRRQPLLIALFVVWVLAPFVALVAAHVISKRWSVLSRATLSSVMLVVTLGSLAIYGDDALRPRKAQAAFVYVAVPPASCLLIATVLPIAALISRSWSRRSVGA